MEFDNEIQRYKYIEDILINSTNNMLLFIDNIYKTQIEDKSLDIIKSIDAIVVATSRFSELDGFKLYSLDFLNEDNSIEVFCKYYKKDIKSGELEYIKELVNLVSYHTLSVELLAKSANRPDCCLAEYLKDLKNKGFGYPNLQIHTNHTQQDKTIAEHLLKLFLLKNVSKEFLNILLLCQV